MTNEIYILEKIKESDATAFKEIFYLYVKKVYNFVFKYVKDTQEAEDITQVVFEKLWENRTSINTSKSFEGFLFTIAYRVTIDYFRKESALKNINTVELQDDALLMSDNSSADYLINQHQFESLYQKALNTLTDKRKEIFLLSRHDGLSNKEIAKRLNISVKTVENQMSAALSSLRDFFSKSNLLVFIFSFFL